MEENYYSTIKILKEIIIRRTKTPFETCAIFNAINAMRELQRYKDVGTVEELRISMKKQIPKKITVRNDKNYTERKNYMCNSCGKIVLTVCDGITASPGLSYCFYCGQKLDFSCVK